MADQSDVRRVVLALPGTAEAEDHFGFSAPGKGGKRRGVVWAWNERIEPKKPRVPNPNVIAVRVANLQEKETLLAADPAKFFTEPHYNGYPAVLVHLEAIDVGELTEVITDAWRAIAPARLVREFDRDPAADRQPGRSAADRQPGRS